MLSCISFLYHINSKSVAFFIPNYQKCLMFIKDCFIIYYYRFFTWKNTQLCQIYPIMPALQSSCVFYFISYILYLPSYTNTKPKYLQEELKGNSTLKFCTIKTLLNGSNPKIKNKKRIKIYTEVGE